MFYYNELKPLLNKISSNNEDIESIQLSHKKITDKNLLQISDALQMNTNVEEIWLTNNLITEVGSLTGVLEKNESVTEVYLGGNKIGDQGGKIASYMMWDLCYTCGCHDSLTPHKASCIAALIQKNSTITDMGIEENNITDDGAKMLADALSHNSTLQTLKLNGNNIDSFDTMIAINEKLKQNKDEAMKKLYEEHPEYEMQKIKKIKKKKKRSRSDKDRKERSEKDKEKNGDKSKPSSRDEDSKIEKVEEDNSNIADQFLQERKKSLEDGNGTGQKSIADKFKSGLKIGSKGTDKPAAKPAVKPKGALC
jgi:hypothetical protein